MILDVHEDESDSLQEHKQQCCHVKLFHLFSQNKHIWHFLILITSVTMATAVLWGGLHIHKSWNMEQFKYQ